METNKGAEAFIDELEARAADEQQREFLELYLAGVELPPKSKVLELGCGSGAVSRRVARWPGVAEVVGLDVSEPLLEYARAFSANYEGLSFVHGDACHLPFGANLYDVVVLHCVLDDVKEPEAVLSEAFRVLVPGGILLLFEPDFSSLAYSAGEGDPMQTVAWAAARQAAHDPYLSRRLSALVRREGFRISRERVFSYYGGANPQYLLDLFDRGAQSLVGQGLIGSVLADALSNELRRRVALGIFPGSLNYVSVQAAKPQADLASGI